MSVWDWISEYQRAIGIDDHSRRMLFNFYRSAMAQMDINPDAAIALFHQGRALAEQLSENWWIVFFDHWTLQTLLHHKRDYAAALELAVKTAVESRKPEYAALPQRICAHEDMITAYVDTDPHGYAEQIQQALNYMQAEITPELECYYCVHGLDADFACIMEHPDAERKAAHYMAAADASGESHYKADARLTMCELAFRRADWEELLGLAHEGGQNAARIQSTPIWIAEYSIWGALALRHLKREEDAVRAYQFGISRASRLKATPSARYYDALCAYHEAGGDLSAAVAMRDQQLRSAIVSGSPYFENLAQVKRCELLAQMGTLTEADLNAARAAADKLKDPSRILVELEKIVRPDSSPSLRSGEGD
jgi:hypothetical protein